MGSWDRRPRLARVTGWLRSVAPVALVVVGCVSTSAASAQSPSLRDFLFPHRQDVAGLNPGRYVPSEGETFFVDRGTSGALLLRFGDSPEVWALKPVSGPRGDIIYKDDAGEDVLRATRLGGLTLFTSERPGGAPAAYAGDGPSLRPAAVSGANGLFQTLVQSSIRASRAAQHLIVLLDPADILVNIQAAYKRPDFGQAAYAVLHTGPSATADIEGVLIHGAQGVRSLTVLLLQRKKQAA